MSRAIPVIALAFVLSSGIARADAVPFRFEQAIYFDDKETPLREPEGVACGDTGQVAVADTGNGRIVLYTHRDGRLGGGTSVKLPQVVYPTRLQYDAKGNLLVLDGKARKIFRLDPKGALLGTIDIKGSGGLGGALPVSFKVDASDNLYVLEVVGGKVLVLDSSGKSLREIDLPKGKNAFADVHVDVSGTVYVVDSVAAQVWSAEKTSTAFKPFTPAMKDRMGFPVYMTGSKGRIFLVDQNGNGVAVLGTDGTFLGRSLSIGWSDGLVYYPSQLCINGAGDGFLADRSNNRVQVFAVGK